jgi:hypothetical protein
MRPIYILVSVISPGLITIIAELAAALQSFTSPISRFAENLLFTKTPGQSRNIEYRLDVLDKP